MYAIRSYYEIISTSSEIANAYGSGRGSLRVRARYEFEEMARGAWQLVVKELPPGVSSAKVLSEIGALMNPQPKPGKKAIEQSRITSYNVCYTKLLRLPKKHVNVFPRLDCGLQQDNSPTVAVWILFMFRVVTKNRDDRGNWSEERNNFV